MSNAIQIFTAKLCESAQSTPKLTSCGLCLIHTSNIDDVAFDQIIHAKEYEYADTLTNDQRKAKYLLGRFCAKKAIQALKTQLKLEEIYIDKGIHKNPIIVSNLTSNLNISLSSTKQFTLALACPDNMPTSVDIESISSENFKALEHVTTAQEKILIEPWLNRGYALLDMLTLFWSAKEALVKALKCGFHVNYDILTIESIEISNGLFIIRFKHFHHLKSISLIQQGIVLSLGVPLTSNFVESNQLIKSLEKSLKHHGCIHDS